MQSLSFLAPVYEQQGLAHHLVLSGSIMFLGGLIIGALVYGSKYPRLTLYCHIEGVSYGSAMIITGLILTQKQFVGELTKGELFVVWLGQVVGWPMWISQILQALFWGTNQMNRIVPSLAAPFHFPFAFHDEFLPSPSLVQG